MITRLATTLLVALATQAAAQIPESPAPNTPLVPTAAVSTIIPASGVLRVLLIFTDFPDDTFETTDPRWVVGHAPVFMEKLIDSTVEQRSGRKHTLTTYFRDMSNGRLEVIGTVDLVFVCYPRRYNPSIISELFSASMTRNIEDQFSLGLG